LLDLIWFKFYILFRIWWVAFRAYPFLGQCRAWPVDSQSSNKPKMHIGKTSVKHRWNIDETSVKHWWNISETSAKHWSNIRWNIDETSVNTLVKRFFCTQPFQRQMKTNSKVFEIWSNNSLEKWHKDQKMKWQEIASVAWP
jgi:hypothetical protein